MGCVRLDNLSIEDMQRLAGQPHDYPRLSAACIGCGAPLPPSATPLPTYCAPDCAAQHRLRTQARFGRAPLSPSQEALQTHCGYSYTPPTVKS